MFTGIVEEVGAVASVRMGQNEGSMSIRGNVCVEGVSLGYVEIEGSNRWTEGTCTIPYTQNGTCRPFSVLLKDPQGNYALLNVDALSSIRTLEYGKLDTNP